jgi:hypothetical protein
MENGIGSVLVDRAKYGRIHPKIIFRGPGLNISVPTIGVKWAGIILRGSGYVFGALGALGTMAQYQTGQIGKSELTLDLIMGAAGFIPGAGWAISGAYFISKPVTVGMMQGIRSYNKTHQGDGLIYHLDH